MSGTAATVVSVLVTAVIMVGTRVLWLRNPSPMRALASSLLGIGVVVAALIVLGAVTEQSFTTVPAAIVAIALGAALQLRAKSSARRPPPNR